MPARLAVYFPLADPALPIALLDLYADAGVDVVEFGWPARNPLLDGPDVRASMTRALAHDPRVALAAATRLIRGRLDGPKALAMTYAEPDHPALVRPDLLEGLDAILVVGAPGDPNRVTLEAEARKRGAAISAFLPLPLQDEYVATALRADFYVMVQAATGLTGPRTTLDPANGARIAGLRAEGVSRPILLGFGVSSGEQARVATDLGADGVVVGSAALRAGLAGRAELAALLKDLRRGLDG